MAAFKEDLGGTSSEFFDFRESSIFWLVIVNIWATIVNIFWLVIVNIWAEASKYFSKVSNTACSFQLQGPDLKPKQLMVAKAVLITKQDLFPAENKNCQEQVNHM